MRTRRPSEGCLGQTLTRKFAAGFTLTERAYAASLTLPKHTHTLASFCLVLHGQFVQIWGHDTLECRSSTVLFCPAGECHADTFSAAGARCFVLETNERWEATVQEIAPAQNGPGFFQCGEPAWLMTRLHREFRRPDTLSPLVVEGLALELAGEVVRTAPHRERAREPRWMMRVRELLRSHFDQPLCMQTLAQEAGVHVTHLARSFRRVHGCTVGDYIRRLRVEAACKRLASSKAPLAEIALASGFAHQSHLCATFRKLLGVTPGQFREHFRTR